MRDVIEATKAAESKTEYLAEVKGAKMSKKDRLSLIERLEKEMKDAAKNLQFEKAAQLRDAIMELKVQD
ncbi:UvrABC system protein B [compost metagenome]